MRAATLNRTMILMMEAARTPETSANIHLTER
jgi:hypothetical protein